MKARRQRELMMMAFAFLFEEFVGAGGRTAPRASDPTGSAQPLDDPPPVAAPAPKRRPAAKATRRPPR